MAATAAAGALMASAEGIASADEILRAYKAAHGKQDIPALMNLVLFQSGGSTEKDSWRKDFEAEARSKVTVKLVPFSEYAMIFAPEHRKRIRPSIKLVNWLVVEFPPQESPGQQNQRSALYPIGEENGRFFIIGP